MRVDAEITYQTGPDAVAAMLADADFVRRKCDAMGALERSAKISGSAPGAFTATSSRTMPTDDFPDVARTFVGDKVTIKQVDDWGPADADGSREGTVTVEISGAPLKVTGQMWLRPDGAGTVQTIDGELKASVPLIGGKLEKAAHPAIMAAIRKEHETGQEWLGE